MAPHHTLKATYASRSQTATHPLNAYLFKLMDLKASNLCLSADVATARELLYLADKLGPSIVVLKTHHDMVSGWDFHPQTGTGAKLASLARRHGFLIFEDRKFGDIGNTVELQYTGGSARIVEWAHIINVNMVPGKASVTSLANAAKRWLERYPYEVKTSVTVGTPTTEDFDDNDDDGAGAGAGRRRGRTADSGNGRGSDNDDQDDGDDDDFEDKMRRRQDDGRKGSIVSVTTVTQQYETVNSPRLTTKGTKGTRDEVLFPGIEEAPMTRGLLILAQMSSAGNFMNREYTQACVEAAREHKAFVMGYVSQESLNTEPDDHFIHMTPGCQLPPEDEDQDAAVQGDGKGQQYNTPQKIIGLAGADIVIVGRGILKAGDPEGEAERYRSAAWKAYTERVR
ncbi:orotidine 5'-phosphate decarboxylase [Claviceps africana]|uniref:Orotidine 5'-phosphate decarboxylase n=1 Tax=Claviceps africana TaxID=83212 RepID=A0A8K0JFG9_9HYPO|nr:orotidine 5'-phosphate decarboxylase [Claviceps africana]